MPREAGFNAVILAARRRGTVDPLAATLGSSHKCVVPIAGAPLIAHVARALAATPGLARLRVVVEPEMFDAITAILPEIAATIDCVPAADNLADSVFAATQGIDGPIVVTTADNVLLTPGAVEQMLATLAGGADVALAMATQGAVLAAHPEGQRRFYRFADDAYSNCNLYAFAGRDAVNAAESFRSGGQFVKKPLRLVAAVGPVNLALMLLGKLTLAGALGRMSRRFRLKVAPVILADGSHAIDVDNERTYRVAGLLLARRAAGGTMPMCRPAAVTAPAGRHHGPVMNRV